MTASSRPSPTRSESEAADAKLCVHVVSISRGECIDGITWMRIDTDDQSEIRCNDYVADRLTIEQADTVVLMLPHVEWGDLHGIVIAIRR